MDSDVSYYDFTKSLRELCENILKAETIEQAHAMARVALKPIDNETILIKVRGISRNFDPIQCIKILRTYLNLELKDALVIVKQGKPWPIHGLSPQVFAQMVLDLESRGALVDVVDSLRRPIASTPQPETENDESEQNDSDDGGYF